MTNISQKMLDGVNTLIPFTSGYAQKLHASGLAKQLDLPQKTVARKLDYLKEKKLLEFVRVGKNKYFFLDWDKVSSFSLIQMVENYKELKFLAEHPKLSVLINELAWKNSLILFGSYAKNRAKEDSDVDLLILRKKNKEAESIIKRYPFETNPHFFTFAHFKKILEKNEPLAKEIVRHHVLFGEKEKIIKALISYSRK